MTTTTFTLAADTNVSELAAEVGQNFGAYYDLKAECAFGDHTVELGRDGVGDERIDVMFFPAILRAAIDDNGGTHWTDAASVDDAIRRYRKDDMAE